MDKSQLTHLQNSIIVYPELQECVSEGDRSRQCNKTICFVCSISPSSFQICLPCSFSSLANDSYNHGHTDLASKHKIFIRICCVGVLNVGNFCIFGRSNRKDAYPVVLDLVQTVLQKEVGYYLELPTKIPVIQRKWPYFSPHVICNKSCLVAH